MARMRIVICLALASALHAASPTADTAPHPGGSAWADGGETGKRFIVQAGYRKSAVSGCANLLSGIGFDFAQTNRAADLIRPRRKMDTNG
jgi:hypothetical protein